MYSLLLLFTLVPFSMGNILPCTCINPFAHTIQPHLGDRDLTCKYKNNCYVECSSSCGDVEPDSLAAGRCISMLACHTLVTPPVVEGSIKVVLSGSGPVTAYQGHSLGLYTYKNETGYYEQDGGDFYLKDDLSTGLWYTFPHIIGCDRNNTFSCIAQWAGALKSETLSGTDWSFSKNNNWVKDDSIHFQPMTSDSCLNCASILLASTGPASQSEYFGTFKTIPSFFSAGRPVYKNEAGKFLMMKNAYTSFSVWDDTERSMSAGEGVVESSRGLRSLTGPTCATDILRNWQFVDGDGEWVDDETVTATCQD